MDTRCALVFQRHMWRTSNRTGAAPCVPPPDCAMLPLMLPIFSLLRWARARAGAVKRRGEAMLLPLVVHQIPLPPSVAEKRVVFVGASVGKAWRLPLVFPNIQTLDEYSFDKSEPLERAIAASPDAIILKECAAYFPSRGDVDTGLVERWVARIRQAGVRPVLATVVPVTAVHARDNPGRQEELTAFNDWLRSYAAAEGIALLDLEQALRVSSADRHLDHRLDSGDGLHLSWQTYRRHLDPLIPPLLLRTFGPEA